MLNQVYRNDQNSYDLVNTGQAVYSFSGSSLPIDFSLSYATISEVTFNSK